MDPKDLKIKELRAKTVEELKDVLENVSAEYADIKFKATTGQVENTSQIRQLRRGIARVNSLITEKENA
mgnify:CR=1 FL=1